MSSTPFARLGEQTIAEVIRAFYGRAFSDPIIGHFFFGKDHEHLIAQQIAFSIAMLGGRETYQGRPIGPVHAPLAIRGAHFSRRQVLMREVMEEAGLPLDVQREWLEREQEFRRVIMR